jgi:hypothetical protein
MPIAAQGPGPADGMTDQSVFVDLLEHRAHAPSAEKTMTLFLDIDLAVGVELGEHLL